MRVADETHQRDALVQATQRKASLRQTAGAVFWSFFGVRKSKDHAADVARLNPVHVIIMGVVGAAIFVGVLITIVTLVVGK
jgi:predicted mannosyl-3-phosphoglycerate phosphatase (HAD superfamily)